MGFKASITWSFLNFLWQLRSREYAYFSMLYLILYHLLMLRALTLCFIIPCKQLSFYWTTTDNSWQGDNTYRSPKEPLATFWLHFNWLMSISQSSGPLEPGSGEGFRPLSGCKTGPSIAGASAIGCVFFSQTPFCILATNHYHTWQVCRCPDPQVTHWSNPSRDTACLRPHTTQTISSSQLIWARKITLNNNQDLC